MLTDNAVDAICSCIAGVPLVPPELVVTLSLHPVGGVLLIALVLAVAIAIAIVIRACRD